MKVCLLRMNDKTYIIFIAQLFLTLILLIVSLSTQHWLDMHYEEQIESESKLSYILVKEHKGLFGFCIQRKLEDTVVIQDQNKTKSNTSMGHSLHNTTQTNGTNSKESNNKGVDRHSDHKTESNNLKDKDQEGDNYGLLKDHQHDKVLSKRMKTYCGSLMKIIAQFEEFIKYHPKGELNFSKQTSEFRESEITCNELFLHLAKCMAAVWRTALFIFVLLRKAREKNKTTMDDTAKRGG